jgi:PucR family transcriptional regulator, purine catabolism regulatory protein
MITVQDVLTASAFHNSELLAGNKGLIREVTTITVAELPDAANWLRGGELVCTTAFFVSNTVVHQKEWIESLIHNGASALAIKTSRFLGSVPTAIIDVANQYDFPIIGMPHEITWPTVIESFMDFFMSERMRIMKLVEEIQSNLINLVLENNSIQSIAEKIAQLVGNPIILEDARLQVMAIGNIEEEEPSKKEDIQSVLNKRVEKAFRNKIVKSSFYKNIQKGMTKEKSEFIETLDGYPEVQNVMFPIYSNKSVYGFISLLGYRKPHTLTDLIVLQNSTTALALQLTKQYLYEQTFRKKTLALIEDIVHGRIHTQIVFEYDFLNINWSNPMIAILVEFNENHLENDLFWHRTEELISTIIKKHIMKHFGQVIIGNEGSLFTILVSYSPSQAKRLTALLKEDMGHSIEELERHFETGKFQVGVGGVYDKLEMTGKSYKDAKTALSVVKKFERKGSMLFFEDIGIHRILSMIRDTEEIRDFCDDFLSELKQYDVETGNVLVETLHMYLLCDCSIKETAERLFLHSNTVAYRIKKIKQIIKHDLDSPEFKMAYLFALESNALIS